MEFPGFSNRLGIWTLLENLRRTFLGAGIQLMKKHTSRSRDFPAPDKRIDNTKTIELK